MATKFYHVRNAQFRNCRSSFTWAMGYGPLEEDMPFLLPGQLEIKLRFWKANPRKPGLYGENGSKWPDFLGHGGGMPSFFVSERVVNSLKASGIEIARLTHMPIASIKSRNKRLKEQTPPRYFVLEAPYAIEMDYEASGVPIDAGGIPIARLPDSPNWTLRLASWRGADLMCYPNMWKRPTFTLICTERVVQLAEREGWTNCYFEPINAA